MDLKSLGQTIIKIGAPLLGGVIAGPAGTAIANIVASEFGVDTSENLIKTLEADPGAKEKLIEIQTNSKIELQRIAMQMAENELKYGTQQQEIDFQNTKDARDNFFKTKSWMPQFVSISSILGFYGCIFLIAQYHQEEQDQQVLYMLLGSVSMAFGAVINFWLGSSAGSRIKDMENFKKN